MVTYLGAIKAIDVSNTTQEATYLPVTGSNKQETLDQDLTPAHHGCTYHAISAQLGSRQAEGNNKKELSNFGQYLLVIKTVTREDRFQEGWWQAGQQFLYGSRDSLQHWQGL